MNSKSKYSVWTVEMAERILGNGRRLASFGALSVLLCATGCAAPASVPTSEDIAEASLASSEKCQIDDDCTPTGKPCTRSICVAGTCGDTQIAAGEPCSSGVGVCQSDFSCKAPVGNCKEPSPAPVSCSADADCVDFSECTWGECVNGSCRRTPDSNGGPCLYAGMACNAGACCAFPAGACEPSKPTPRQCGKASECDDHDSCTHDSCEKGTCQHAPHPDGTYCTMSEGGEGQCLGSLCCLP